MPDNDRSIVARIRMLHQSLHEQLEIAEARVHPINVMIGQLAEMGVITDAALFGLIIYEEHYNVFTYPGDSDMVLQSVLMIPGGLGVIRWDTEEYQAFRREPLADQSGLELKFVPFAACGWAVKALLLPQIEPLMELLFTRYSLHFDG